MSNASMLARERVRRFVGEGDVDVSDAALVVLMVCNVVTTVGLAGDIARHLQNPDDLEGDFLSSWHLVLYGGVTAVALWLGVGAWRHGPRFLRSVGTTTVGFGFLALGGPADAIWHEVFGTEANVEALVSPPHLLVFTGLALLLASPVVVLWRRPTTRLGLVPSLIALSSAVSVVLVTSLFTGFLTPLASGLSLQVGYQEPVVGESFLEYDQVRGLGIAVWTSAVLVAAFTVVLVRFKPMPGLVGLSVFLCGAPALAITDPAVIRPLVLGYAMAGLVTEAMTWLVGRPTLGRLGATANGFLLPSMLWASTFALLAQEGRLGWSQALWGGTILLSGMVGAAVAALVALPAPTGGAVVDSPIGPRPA